MLGKRDKLEEDKNAKPQNDTANPTKQPKNTKSVKTDSQTNEKKIYKINEPEVIGLNKDDHENYKSESDDSDFNSQIIEHDGEISSSHSSVDEETLKEFQQFIKNQQNPKLQNKEDDTKNLKQNEQNNKEEKNCNEDLENGSKSEKKNEEEK